MSGARTNYHREAPALTTNEKGTIIISHNHTDEIDYSAYRFYERSKLKRDIDKNSKKITGCIAFFKSLAETTKDDNIRAQAIAASEEDKALLAEFKAHRPWP